MQGRKKGVKMRLQNMFKKTGERESCTKGAFKKKTGSTGRAFEKMQ